MHIPLQHPQALICVLALGAPSLHMGIHGLLTEDLQSASKHSSHHAEQSDKEKNEKDSSFVAGRLQHATCTHCLQQHGILG